MKPRIAILWIALGLAGCSTASPMTYLILSPVSGTVYASSGPAVAVGQVAIPPAIDRSFLTTGSSATTLQISYNARWAAPLGGMAQTILARDLAARLPEHDVLMPGDPVPAKALIVSINITTFLPYPDQVVLEADWSLSRPGGQIMRSARVQIVTASAATPGAQAQAMSQALGQLADKIAQHIAD